MTGAGVVGGRRAAFVVNGGGDAARLPASICPPCALLTAHGVVLVALLFAIGDGIDGEGCAVLPFGMVTVCVVVFTSPSSVVPCSMVTSTVISRSALRVIVICLTNSRKLPPFRALATG